MPAPRLSRRRFLAAGAAALAGLPLAAGAHAPGSAARRLGLTDAACAVRLRALARAGLRAPTDAAVEMLRLAASLGAGCVQTGVRGWAEGHTGPVRDLREALGIELEGQISLPASDADLPRFTAEARAARQAGARVLRAACLNGRRYEDFDSAAAWREFAERSHRAIARAEPVARREGVVLAVENHKDWRAGELVEIVRRLDSEAVGVCLDLGNNVALLEDPMEVVETLAPWTRTVHFKDMAVREYDEGFLLAEVPLGLGYLDLERMVAVCERAAPGVRFNLEMITRDPLRVPVLGDRYWATFDALPARDLARTLADARRHGPAAAFQQVSTLSLDEQLALEERNLRACFDHARERLGM